MDTKNRIFYDNANRYRIHQDTLRWTLAAGYLGSFVAAVGGIGVTAGSVPLCLSLMRSIGLWVFGTVYLFVLAVENWYYNLFADYVKECEVRLHRGNKLRPLSEYAADRAPSTSPGGAPRFLDTFDH